jgi:hypothetical protein
LARKILPPTKEFPHTQGRLIVSVHGSLVPVEPTTFSVIVPVPVGDGCINDTGEDRQGYMALFRGELGLGLTPKIAAEAAYLRALARPRQV